MFCQGENKLEGNKRGVDENDSTSHAKNNMESRSEVIEFTVERLLTQKIAAHFFKGG